MSDSTESLIYWNYNALSWFINDTVNNNTQKKEPHYENGLSIRFFTTKPPEHTAL